jgi:hypothetical protein
MIHAANLFPGVTAYTQSFQSLPSPHGAIDWPARWIVGDPEPALVAAGLGEPSRGLTIAQHTERVLHALVASRPSPA